SHGPDTAGHEWTSALSGARFRMDRIARKATGYRLQAVRKLAKETGHTPNQIVLAWMLQNAPAALPLVAVSDSVQLEENLGALDIRLSSKQLDDLNLA
ncbi:MAG: aldo/keto reductase, partial [Paenibacillus macerans]|nr:aldo/keto reductase [Paenibacillus macerans]